jgi:type III restriction enzyme
MKTLFCRTMDITVKTGKMIFKSNCICKTRLALFQNQGNIFLTNIHRVYEGDIKEASFDDDDTWIIFWAEKVVGKTNDSKIDLGEIVRDVDELMVINDEAHHIHDPKMAWFKSIEDIHNQTFAKRQKISFAN